MGFIFEFIVENHGTDNIIWIFYILNFIFAAIAYKLGFARKLPLLKEIIVYIMLAIGTIILTILSLVKAPITEVLIITSIVLAIYRYRLYKDRKAKRNIN